MAACSALPGTTFGLDQLASTQPTGPAFTQSLTGEYRAFAGSERDLGEWIPMWHFARKGLQASTGVAVAPDSVDDWEVDDADAVKALTDARAQLMDVLAGPAPQRLPALTATAQVKYECWLLHQHEGSPADAITACHGDFVAAMNAIQSQLHPPPAAAPPPPPPPVAAPPPQPMRVFFDLNQSKLSGQAQQALADIVKQIQASPAATVKVTGYTDGSGPAKYNQVLSQRRAQAVAQALIAAGVPPGRIVVDAKGASDPLVPGADGHPESQNRRVEIHLSP